MSYRILSVRMTPAEHADVKRRAESHRQTMSAYVRGALSIRASIAGRGKCLECGGDGYYKGPRLGDEACPKCKGTGLADSGGEG